MFAAYSWFMNERMLLDEEGKRNHETGPVCMFTNSQYLREGTCALTGTSVKACWWKGQTKPDGSIPSGSSVQSTCIN